jgi:hypothetical protein
MYAFNDNNNSIDHHSNFIINIIENISLFCFDINDSLNTENIKNTWKLNIYNYENSNNIASFLFCDLSFLYLVCFVQEFDLKLVESLQMIKTFRSKVLASLVINKVDIIFTKTYDEQFESDYNNNSESIINNLNKISTVYNALSGVTEHFKRLKGFIQLFII